MKGFHDALSLLDVLKTAIFSALYSWTTTETNVLILAEFLLLAASIGSCPGCSAVSDKNFIKMTFPRQLQSS